MRSLVSRLTPRQFGALLVILVLLALVPGSRTLPLLDRDEPRFAGAAVEMIHRGEWVVPYFNDQYRFDKPVLTYWLMRAGYAVFGINEFGARAHSIAAALSLVLLLYVIGRRWFTESAGRFAAVGLLLCAQMLVHGRSAVADMPMVLAVTATQWSLFEFMRAARGSRAATGWLTLLGVALGLGFLAKGPIAWIVPVLTLVLHRFVFWRRPTGARGWLGLLGGLALGTLILAPWGLLALMRTHGEFWTSGMGHHVVDRGMKAFEGHRSLPGFYLLTTFASLFPWFAFLGLAVQTLRINWNSTNAFLAAWFVAPFIVFTFYATQLMHYVLPAYPAFLLILGQAGADPLIVEPRWGRILRFLVLGFAGGAVAVLVLLGAVWDVHAPWGPLGPAFLGGAVFLSGLLFASRLLRRPDVPLALACALMVAAGIAIAGNALRQVLPAVRIGAISKGFPKDTSYYAARFGEPTLVFYSGQHWSFFGAAENLRGAIKDQNPKFIVLTEGEWKLDAIVLQRLAAVFRGRPGLPPAGRDLTAEANRVIVPGEVSTTVIEGLNIAKGQWVRLRLITTP